MVSGPHRPPDRTASVPGVAPAASRPATSPGATRTGDMPTRLSQAGRTAPVPPPGEPGGALGDANYRLDVDQTQAASPDDRDRQRRQQVTRKARDFLVHIDTLGRLLTIHDPANQAVQAALRDLVKDVRELQAGGEDLSLVFAEGHAFVNGVWVRANRRAWDAAVLLTDRLKDLEGRGLVLETGTEADTLLGLTRFLKQAPPEGVSGKEHFAKAGLPGIRLLPMPSAADRARIGREALREQAVEVFTQGLETVSRAELANLDLYLRRRQRALVQTLVQLAEQSPEDLLTLTTMRDPTLPAGAHNMLVCIYALALGRLLDLGRRDLLRLGVAALNHNLGEVLLPEDLFATPRELHGGERAQVQQHPLLGVRHMLRHYGFGLPTVERALVAAEHHLRFDGEGGYPFPSYRSLHLFSRIVAVADVFDALCSPRPWREAFPPDQAIKLVGRMAGKQLDPVLVRRLLWLVGRYPPGSLVELDSGEWAVVVGPGHGAYPLVRPRVLLISDEQGFELDKPVLVDLGERHPRRRAWLRTIARTRNPSAAGIKVAPFFFTDRIEVPPARLDLQELERDETMSSELPRG